MSKNIKYSASFFIIILSVFLGVVAYAQEGQSDIEGAPVACTMDVKVCPDGSSVGRVGPRCEFSKCPGELGGKFQEVREDMKINREENQAKRQEVKGEIEGIKDELKVKREEHKVEVQNLIDSMKLKREEFKVEFDKKKEEVKLKAEEMRAKFKEDLTKIKDEKKKLSAEKIVEIITNLNTQTTNNLSSKIDQIENVLVGIESRITKAETNGLDVTSVKAQVEKAKTAIADARSAVVAQTAKTYTATITDEATLRAEMKKIRDAFNADIKVVREKVKLAHEAVRTTATTLAKIPKVNDDAKEVAPKVEDNSTNNQ